MKIKSVSELGLVRQSNQDSILTLQNDTVSLCMVCDGIGGAFGGDLASQSVVSYFEAAFVANPPMDDKESIVTWFDETLRHINYELNQISLSNINYIGMGTTLSAVVFYRDTWLGFNIGDSRIYTYKEGDLKQITHDQTYAYEMYLRDEITEEEVMTHPKRHILMNAVGISPDLQYDINESNDAWDYILVSSDGVHGYVSNEEIETIFKNYDDIEEIKKALLEISFSKGAFDNISFIVVKGENHG